MGDIKTAIEKIVPKQGKNDWGKPSSSYKLTFESPQAQLEPIYYWLLDFIQDGEWETKKITDNFMSSPGSGHFAEIGQKVSKMQEEGMKLIGLVNTIIKSVVQLIYDLKEFEIRLENYDEIRSEDKKKKEAGMLSLKQIWLDNVDIKKGNGSINVLTSQAGFVTLRELFFGINTPEELEKISDKKEGIVNLQTKRLITPRLNEFWKWIKYSEKELRKRMNIEKNYLKSQVETIKMYSSWMRPYLKAAEDLKQKGFESSAALVNAFSTSMFELEILGKKSAQVPEKFKDYNLKRNYYSIILIKLIYRGHVSQRVTQKGDYGFALGGKVDMTFESYVLNGEELKLVEEEMEREDVADSMKFSGDIAADAISEIKEDLDYFLGKKEDKIEEEKKKKKEKDINPFKALFDLFKKDKKKKKGDKKEIIGIKDIKKDNFVEKSIRANAADEAVNFLYNVYDIYKKSHGMASAPGDGFENWEEKRISEPETKLKNIFSGQTGSEKHREK
tara:strand:- start:1413 stop:2918 length:1506 start_codon:yes stop_codon:yes gene_type:complete